VGTFRKQERLIFKVGLMGASGRMGREVAALLADGFTLNSDAFELSDGVTLSGHLLSIEGMPLRTLRDPEREPVHVWIDFSRPEGTLELLRKTDRPVVICTTGFTPEQMGTIENHARTRPLLLAPNTSMGMHIMGQMVKAAAPLSQLGFTTVLDDDHHVHKKDAPSGTAKRLLDQLQFAGFESTPVHVTRAGTTVGTHTVRWIADGEELLVQHRVTDRRIFARGALWAAQFLLRQTKPRVYLFDEVSV
jgi:4-hydroxy-tetrahydrodipicolinate reductase